MLKTVNVIPVIRGISWYIYREDKSNKILTSKSLPDGRKFFRFKIVGTRAIDVVVHRYAATSFGLQMRIEKVGGNKNRTVVSYNRHI